jgi:hypothetical protein
MDCARAAGLRDVNGNFDKLGLGAALIISYAKAPLEAIANSVGSDMMGGMQSYPLNFRGLQDSPARCCAPIANGYSTRYGAINCLLAQ